MGFVCCSYTIQESRMRMISFDMISGTSGLLGAADGAFLLQKEKRTGNVATLEVSGRDQQDQKLYLIRNTETLLWDLQKAETELMERTARAVAR